MELNNKLTDKRVRLRIAAQDYQSSLSWYQENLDSPNAEQDCDESTAAFKREIAHREMDIIADLLDEIDELQERGKADSAEPIGWTDAEELRSVEKVGCGYLFKANPISPNADPRRVIKLYRHAQPAPVMPDEKPMPEASKMHAIDAVAAIAEVRGWNACRAAMLKGGAK